MSLFLTNICPSCIKTSESFRLRVVMGLKDEFKNPTGSLGCSPDFSVADHKFLW